MNIELTEQSNYGTAPLPLYRYNTTLSDAQRITAKIQDDIESVDKLKNRLQVSTKALKSNNPEIRILRLRLHQTIMKLHYANLIRERKLEVERIQLNKLAQAYFRTKKQGM